MFHLNDALLFEIANLLGDLFGVVELDLLVSGDGSLELLLELFDQLLVAFGLGT